MITFGELLDQWLHSYVELNCRLSTQDSYRSQVSNRIAPALGTIPLTKLTPRHIQSFIDRVISQGRLDGKGDLYRRTPQLLLQIIHGALEYAMRMDRVVRNASDAVVLPTPEQGKFKIMAVRDIAKFLGAAKETLYYLVYVVALLTGMRLGEIMGLRWIDLKNNLTLISVTQELYKRRGVCKFEKPKSKYSRRSISVPPILTELLRQHRLQQEVEEIYPITS